MDIALKYKTKIALIIKTYPKFINFNSSHRRPRIIYDIQKIGDFVVRINSGQFELFNKFCRLMYLTYVIIIPYFARLRKPNFGYPFGISYDGMVGIEILYFFKRPALNFLRFIHYKV